MLKPLRCALVISAALLCVNAFSAENSAIPTLSMDPALHAKLPTEIQKSGVLISANNGSFPPYDIATGTNTLDGASADLALALGQVLGVKIEHVSVGTMSSILTGLSAGRFQMAIGPIGDYPDREGKNDFIDFVKEYVVFAVQHGNPAKLNSLSDTCGLRIAVMSGGSAEQVIHKQSDSCVKEGKPAVTVLAFSDQPTSILAVRSNRSDAFFSSQAPLIYFVNQTHGQLEIAGTGQANGFGDIFQGVVVEKNSAVGAAILGGFQKLFNDGTYAAIMKKWHLEGNMLPAPGLNLAKAQAK